MNVCTLSPTTAQAQEREISGLLLFMRAAFVGGQPTPASLAAMDGPEMLTIPSTRTITQINKLRMGPNFGKECWRPIHTMSAVARHISRFFDERIILIDLAFTQFWVPILRSLSD